MNITTSYKNSIPLPIVIPQRIKTRPGPIIQRPMFDKHVVVAMELPWLSQYEFKWDMWWLHFMSVRDILTTMATIPCYQDIEPILWDSFYMALPENHEPSNTDIENFTHITEIIGGEYYTYVDYIVPEYHEHRLLCLTDNIAVIEFNTGEAL